MTITGGATLFDSDTVTSGSGGTGGSLGTGAPSVAGGTGGMGGAGTPTGATGTNGPQGAVGAAGVVGGRGDDGSSLDPDSLTPAGALASVSVAPINPTEVVGNKLAFTATGLGVNGQTLNLTSVASWSSSDPQVATIGPSGVAVGTGPGTTTISAIVGTFSVSTTLTVTQVFQILTASLPAATPGHAYGPVTLQAVGLGTSTNPYSTTLKWKKVSLPKGLTLSPTGVLSGTLSSKLIGGSSSITVQATETVTTLNGRVKTKTITTVQATIPLTIIQPQPAVSSVRRTSGPSAGGTTVSIKGTSLQGASVVTFGAVDATSFTVNGAGTTITAVTPPEAAGPVDVRVTDPGGTSSTSSADVFTFTP